MKTISFDDLSKLFVSPYSNNKSISIQPMIPHIPKQNPILIEYDIRIISVDNTKTTNLVNGLGYVYKQNGNWTQKIKFGSSGGLIPVHSGQLIRGHFYIPIGLSDIRFQSQLFLLSSVSGDPLVNPQNIATIRVKANGVPIVDKSPNGFDSIVWNYGKYDISALVPVNY